MDVKKEITSRLSEAYRLSGYTYSELEKMTSIPRSTIQRIVTGQMKNIDIDKIKAIADACGVSAEHIMGWDTEENKKDELIDIFESLSSENKEKVKEFMEFLLSKE